MKDRTGLVCIKKLTSYIYTHNNMLQVTQNWDTDKEQICKEFRKNLIYKTLRVVSMGLSGANL